MKILVVGDSGVNKTGLLQAFTSHYYARQLLKMASSSAATIPDEVKRNVRAVLLSKIGGVPLVNFNKDYKALLGSPFPHIKLGFSNPRQALQAMPDCVRFEIKNDEQYLFGIADQSSFMSSFAIKAQFPEFDEKKDRRKRNRNKKGGKEERNRTSRNHQDRQRQSNHNDKQRGQSQMTWQPKQETMHFSSGPSGALNNPASKKYPDLVGNMKGMYSVVVGGATQDEAQNVGMLFSKIGPVAERSQSGNLLFFRFKNLQHAEEVIDTYDGYHMGQNRLRVTPAKEKAPSHKPTQKFGDEKKAQQLQDFAVFQQQQQQQQQSQLQQQQQPQNQHQHQNSHQQHKQQSKQQQHQPQQKQQQHNQQHRQQHNHIQKQQEQPQNLDGLLNVEDKISELNAALMSRMQLPNNIHMPAMHAGNLPNMVTPVNMVNATPLNMVMDTRLSAENTQTKKPYMNRVGKSSNPGSSNSSHHKCSIKVSNIANSLLEKDVHSILETYNPEKIDFKYPSGSHTCYSAIVHLTMRDAERAIQKLNGKVKYDIPLSVKPYTMRNPGQKRRKQQRQRNQSDASSVGDSATSSAATDDVEPANEFDGFGDQPAEDGEEEGPTLADFAARFSNVTI